MNQEIKEKWVVALRSGEYKQGQFRLRSNNNEFCCLGVLCDIYAKEKEVDWFAANTAYNNNYTFIGMEGSLPDLVLLWSELNFEPRIKFKGGTPELTWVNDAGEASFNEIADLIEEQL